MTTAMRALSALAVVALTACTGPGGMSSTPSMSGGAMTGGASLMGGAIPDPVIRQPVLPEYLVGCRGHVLVPALGMTFIGRGGALPTTGQFLREENLTAPYRVIRPGDRMSQDRNPQRLNVELDAYQRIIGLACG